MPTILILGSGLSEPDRYRYTLELCKASWAWEFLRRNACYQQVVADREAEVFGLCAFRRSDLARANSVGLLGTRDLSGGVVHSRGRKQRGRRGRTDPVRPAQMHPPHPGDRGRRQHVVLIDRRRAIQLLCQGPLVLQPEVNLIVMLDSMRYMNLNRATLRAFLSLFRDSRPGRTFRRDTPSALNLRDTLMTYDGKQSGLSNREIVIALYGKDRVADEWASRSGPLRARVRRLVANGEKLVNGGYLRLLR